MEEVMPIQFKLDHVIDKVLAGHTASHKSTLKQLAGVKLSASKAQSVWPRVLEHKWYLSERLGRDVGVRVAAIDYFENIEPPVAAPRIPFRLWTWSEGLPPRLPMMMPFGERLNQ
jgi:hypothetical protein